jgi:hypothetical protein
MVGPIKPSEVRALKTESIPEKVFEVFNALIAAAWDGRSATVRQDQALTRIAMALDVDTSQVFARHLLDIEESYRAAGWDVHYDKPGYNETYEATFRFTLGKDRK